MTIPVTIAAHNADIWQLPAIPSARSQSAVLTDDERDALATLVRRWGRRGGFAGRWTQPFRRRLHRLLEPIDEVTLLSSWTEWRPYTTSLRNLLIKSTIRHQAPMWAWTREEWLATARDAGVARRHMVVAMAYLVADQRDLYRSLPQFRRSLLAQRVFGASHVDMSLERLQTVLRRWGSSCNDRGPEVYLLCDLMLERGSPRLEDLNAEALVRCANRSPASARGVRNVARALVALNIIAVSPFDPEASEHGWLARRSAATTDVPTEWLGYIDRWFVTSTVTPKSRQSVYSYLVKAGRWLATEHPDITSPTEWTRQTAAAWVAAVDRMRIGEWAYAPDTTHYKSLVGKPHSPRNKDQHIGSLRRFFRDCHAWGWFTPQFDPTRTLATPRSIRSLIGTDPRVIADDVWAKLMWAGLNLTAEDLPLHGGPDNSGASFYPLELVRAVAMLWLFGGLRSDEIHRLRRGCVRWEVEYSGETAKAAADASICLLDVPINKTGTAFTKPVDRLVGDAIAQWEAIRGDQPRSLDRKMGDIVDFLFTFRGARIGRVYINRRLIPLLCGKANVPTDDVRGRITSHRARATIATQLYNAKEPMSLFELQAWLGHRSPHSTQHYARITPTTLSKAYRDAGYFERNMRTIEVLVDRDVASGGAAAPGTPWQYFDLGHGYCTYNFFEQCPHRMACARCDFYVPKASSSAHLLEAKSSVQRMLLEIPLTDDERAAAEDDQTAIDRLLERLADVPTPAGPSPAVLARQRISVPLLVIATPAPSPPNGR